MGKFSAVHSIALPLMCIHSCSDKINSLCLAAAVSERRMCFSLECWDSFSPALLSLKALVACYFLDLSLFMEEKSLSAFLVFRVM